MRSSEDIMILRQTLVGVIKSHSKHMEQNGVQLALSIIQKTELSSLSTAQSGRKIQANFNGGAKLDSLTETF